MFFLKELPTAEMLDRYAAQYQEMHPTHVADALTMMRQASLLLRELEGLFSKAGLSQTRFLVLMMLDREPDRPNLRISELSDRLDISKPVITTTVKSLSDDGYVSLQPNEFDGRAKDVLLEPPGKAVLKSLLPKYFMTINDFMSHHT